MLAFFKERFIAAFEMTELGALFRSLLGDFFITSRSVAGAATSLVLYKIIHPPTLVTLVGGTRPASSILADRTTSLFGKLCT